MHYKSVLVDETGKKNTNRKIRKNERHKVFLYNKKLAAVERKARKAARLEAAEAAENANQESN